MIVAKSLPRQLPKYVKEEEITETAKAAYAAIESMIYIQLVLQLVLKGGADDLLQGFYCL